MKILRPLFTVTLSALLAALVPLDRQSLSSQTWEPEAAIAARSGGRSSGGSFGSRSSGSRSSGSRSSGSSSRTPSTSTTTRSSPATSNSPPSSSSNPRGNTGGTTQGGSFNRRPITTPSPSKPSSKNRTKEYWDDDYDDDEQDPAPNPVMTPVPANGNSSPQVYDSGTRRSVQYYYLPPNSNSSYTNTNGATNTDSDNLTAQDLVFLLVFLVVVILLTVGLVTLAWHLLKRLTTKPKHELENEVVTVSKLQIGLLAGAKDLQARLTHLSEVADLDSSVGLATFATNCALALLRHPEYWSHAASSSETVPTRAEAQQRFERITIGERMKFDSETFSRTGNHLTIEDRSADVPEVDFAEYIVVTLVVGTENDQALFPAVHSAEDLEAALKTIGSLTGEYLSVFELLWTPQAAEDSLTAEELIELYPELVPVG